MSALRAAILVGGRSTRMGRDKASAEFRGQTALERLLERFASMQPVVVARPGQQVATEAPLLRDHLPAAAMGGVLTALEHTGARTFVLAVDMPFADPTFARRLAEHPADLVLPEVDGVPQPLHAVYSTACLPPLRDAALAGRWSLRKAWFRALTVAHPTGPWNPAERRSFAGANTPAEWAALEAEAAEVGDHDLREAP